MFMSKIWVYLLLSLLPIHRKHHLGPLASKYRAHGIQYFTEPHVVLQLGLCMDAHSTDENTLHA